MDFFIAISLKIAIFEQKWTFLTKKKLILCVFLLKKITAMWDLPGGYVESMIEAQKSPQNHLCTDGIKTLETVVLWEKKKEQTKHERTKWFFVIFKHFYAHDRRSRGYNRVCHCFDVLWGSSCPWKIKKCLKMTKNHFVLSCFFFSCYF